MITLQRSEIAALKAIGYRNGEIARHYLGVVAVVLLPGSIAGVLGGWALGRVVLDLYGSIFRFPDLVFRMTIDLVLGAIAVSGAAAVLGAMLAVRAAARLPPAEAMQPAAPLRYRRGILDRSGLSRILGPSGMMIAREIVRRPLRTALSALGMGGAVALIVLRHFGIDSLDASLEGRMRREQRQDLAVTFARPLSPRAVSELAHAPGVRKAEAMRAVPARVRYEHRSRDTVLMGLPADGTLRRIIDTSLRAVSLPDGGVLVTRTLGEVLGARVGDRVDLELREGDRRTVRPVIVGFVDEAVGLQVYATDDLVKELERDRGAVSAALLTLDPAERHRVEERLRRSPLVIDVSDLRSDIERLRAMNGSMMDIWTAVSITLSACVIFGVVYNNARIALTMRSRELASLRVLGMSRREISTILIGGLAFEIALAIPIGLVLGRLWSEYFMSGIDKEMFRWAVVVAPTTYLMAAATALLAGAASAMWVRRSLDHLDLIAVLKTRE
jgi:putative ABC transport system permease protein